MPYMENERPLVLVADPAAESVALIGRQLSRAGYEFVSAWDGAEALAIISERRPDAAVIEVTMPQLTGYEVVRELRLDARNRLMPVVMISARAGQLDRDFAFRVGADDYFRKPFRCGALLERIDELLPEPALPPAQPFVRLSRPRNSARLPALAG